MTTTENVLTVIGALGIPCVLMALYLATMWLEHHDG